MKAKVFISNNWRTWLNSYADQHGFTKHHAAQVGADLAKEIHWMLDQPDGRLQVSIESRLGKYQAIVANGGVLSSFDKIGAVRMALWEWALT